MSQENRSLAKLTEDFAAIKALVIEQDGELCPQLEEWLTINEKNVAAKVDGYCYFMDDLKATEEYFKAMAEKFTKARKSCENMRERMKSSIQHAMFQMDKKELSGNDFVFKFQNNPPAVNVINQLDIPEEYKRIEYVVHIEKDKIKADLKAGKDVPGCELTVGMQVRSYVNKSPKLIGSK